jgi:hypothetical protein
MFHVLVLACFVLGIFYFLWLAAVGGEERGGGVVEDHRPLVFRIYSALRDAARKKDA